MMQQFSLPDMTMLYLNVTTIKGAKQQLELLGFDDELVEYLKNAVSYYHSLKKDEMRQDNNF